MLSRQIDSLGRVVIPKEIRSFFGWNCKDLISITTQGKNVILGKIDDCCCLCRTENDVVAMKDGFKLCIYCLKNISNTALD